MGSRYLTDLADVVRSAGLTVIEVGSSPSQTGDAWKRRGRSSGGYDGAYPNHVMVHHTASGRSADGWGDANYCTFSSENRPVCNIYLARDGRVWVCAGGATNTNGSGTCPHCGASDSMNSRAIGIEAGNDGVGEAWPTAQQDAYVVLVGALCANYGIGNSAIVSHFEYAPDRKVDPAGPSRWSKPSGGGGGNKWRMDEFRAAVAGSGGAPIPPPTPTPTQEDDVAVAITAPDDPAGMIFAWNGVGINWITSDDQLAVGYITGVLKMDSEGKPLRNFDKAAIQDLINRGWAGVDGSQFPPGYTRPVAPGMEGAMS